MAVLRILPLPGALKVLLWIVAILASLVALANAANIIANRFVLPYTSGAVCNKSSVAAMLGVMDNVAPYQGENEFPNDIPFDTYFGEQKRRAEEMARAAAEYAAAQQQNDYGNTIEYEEPTYTEDEFGQPFAAEPEQDEAPDEQIDGFEGASADATLDRHHRARGSGPGRSDRGGHRGGARRRAGGGARSGRARAQTLSQCSRQYPLWFGCHPCARYAARVLHARLRGRRGTDV